ncbi:MAG: hypothetical protein OXB89_00475 [Anaerolineaceae bacterium]|nr:hypothetical protein [Anaerolineaceae bacterium]
MEREILITDLTTMGEDRVCVAGIDREGSTFRPILPNGVRRLHLFRDGQVIVRPRALLGMRLHAIRSAAPHIEDFNWHWPEWTRCVEMVDEDCWQQRLRELAEEHAASYFGGNLQAHRGARRRKLRQNNASCSLATLVDVRICHVAFDPERNSPVRLYFCDANEEFYDDIPVTDLGLHDWSLLCIRQGQGPEAISECLKKAFTESQEVVLRVGLGRNRYGWCWFQVNGIYTFPDWLEGRCFADFEDRRPRLL